MAMSRAGDGRTPSGYPRISNLDASGLILFAREVGNYAAKRGSPIAFDWYGSALPALGWFTSGDKFKLDAKHQSAEYTASAQLWLALQQMARQLDESGVPFSLVRDVTGTTATYKQLAEDAWRQMRRESPAEASKARSSSKRSSFDARQHFDAGEVHGRQQAPAEPEPPARGGGSGAGILLLLVGLAFMDD